MPDSIDNSWQINKPLSAAVHTYTLHAEMHEVYVQVHLHKSIYAYLLKRLHFFTSDFHSTDTLKQRQACWVNKSSEKRESTSGLSREGRSSCCVCQRKRKSSDWQDKWKKLGAPHLKMVYIYFGNVKSILDSLHSERRERWWSSLSVLFSLNFFFFLFFFPEWISLWSLDPAWNEIFASLKIHAVKMIAGNQIQLFSGEW